MAPISTQKHYKNTPSTVENTVTNGQLISAVTGQQSYFVARFCAVLTRPSHLTHHTSGRVDVLADYVPEIGDIVSVGGQFTTCVVVEVNRKGRTANLQAVDGQHRMINIPWCALMLLTRPS